MLFDNLLSAPDRFCASDVTPRARQSVREARLHLDSWKQTLKGFENSGKTEKLDSTRAEVEQAEDKLVAATEEAIGLMKSVLDDPEPIKSLNEVRAIL